MGDLKGGECSLAVSWSTEIVSECGKGGDLIEPSDDVREVLSGGLIDHESESTIGNEGGLNVSNGQTISNEELGCLEVAVQNLESSEKISMSLSSLLSFQWVPSEDRNDKADEYGFHFGCNEINPLIDKRFLVVVLTKYIKLHVITHKGQLPCLLLRYNEGWRCSQRWGHSLSPRLGSCQEGV